MVSLACEDAIKQINSNNNNNEFIFQNNETAMTSATTISENNNIPPIQILTSLCLYVGLIQVK